jgi:uncharacterized membrane protein
MGACQSAAGALILPSLFNLRHLTIHSKKREKMKKKKKEKNRRTRRRRRKTGRRKSTVSHFSCMCIHQTESQHLMCTTPFAVSAATTLDINTFAVYG